MPEPTPPEPQADHETDVPRRWLGRGVGGVASASFFSDTSHELVTSLLPTFVTSSLHAGPASLGVIESIADALTGLAKLAGGPLANQPRRRGRLASSGYLGTAVATAAIGLTVAVWQVAILRAIAWASRGIRSPARDAMLTGLVDDQQYGRAFGLERAGDNTGAIVGPVLAAVLVTVIGVRQAIWLSIIPGILAAVSITLAAREARRTLRQPSARRTLSLRWRELHRHGLFRILTPALLFELGNLATTLLILRATDVLTPALGARRAASLAIVLYAAHNAVAAGASLLAGQLCDRRSPRLVLGLGAAAYVAGYLFFGLAGTSLARVVAGFVLAGFGIGLAETAESAVVAQAAPDELRGSAFGTLGLVQAAGDLGATLVAGLLWSALGPAAGFGYAAGWMLLAVLGTMLLLRRTPARQ